VERLGSASAAGHELGVAASTGYRRIAALESAVGFTCLVRGKGLTPAGRELAKLARTTSESLNGIAQRARAQLTSARGTVRITTLDGFAPLLGAPLADLAARFPELRVDVHLGDFGLSLRKRQAEIGLSLIDRPPEALVARKLFPIRFGVYARRDLDLADPRWVMLAAPLEDSWLGRWEAEHVPRERVAAASTSRRLLVDLVAAGVGVGLLPAPLAEGRTDLVELAEYRAKTTSLERNAWLIFSPDLRRDARVKAVVDTLTRHLAPRAK
jgi:DNA-binding transcriptional LysR family regulator